MVLARSGIRSRIDGINGILDNAPPHPASPPLRGGEEYLKPEASHP